MQLNSSNSLPFKTRILIHNSFSAIIVIVFIIIYFFYYNLIKLYRNYLNEHYLNIQSDINITFNNNINKIIRIGIYTVSLKNGGLQRFTSIFINYLDQIKLFKFYLFNRKEKEENEYIIPDNIKRIFIKDPNDINYLMKQIKKNKIDIFIYQFPKEKEIHALNNLYNYNLKDVKVIFYIHSNFFYWFYVKYFYVLDIYKEYAKSKYVVTQIPLEHNYLFKKWGINSILFDNFLTYEYNSIIPSNLSDNTILLVGRGANKLKRFSLGIQAIEYIRQEIPSIQLSIVSAIDNIDYLKYYVENLNLGFNVYFANYSSEPSIYFKTASLNYLTSISESYSLILSETKIFGIPTIIMGLNFLSMSKKGTVIIYDDYPETLAKVSIKILRNKQYKKNLSKEARKSISLLNNEKIKDEWVKLLFLVYNNYTNYTKYFNNSKNDKEKFSDILKTQVKLLKIRMSNMENTLYLSIFN
jgi:hypothetical protein